MSYNNISDIYVKNRKIYKIAYLVSHPIQYHAPLLRKISAEPDMDLTVFFQSDFSVRGYRDKGFGRAIEWDVPLLDGYRYEFLPALRNRGDMTPWSYGIARRLWLGNFDFLWIHGYAKLFNWTAMVAARLASISILVRDDPNALSANRSPLKIWCKRHFFFKGLDILADGFLATGTLNRQYYLENGIPDEKLFWMPNCVDNGYFSTLSERAAPNREAFRARLGLSAHRPVILYASKFERRKRAGDLLAAFERLETYIGANVHPYLLFVGDGEMREELEAKAASRRDDVRFLGFRNQSELPAFFDLCDVFVLPSAEMETWGLVINEVMSVGRAVIVSDRVGCGPDLIREGKNGYIYPVGDIDALARALSRVLCNKETINSMGKASAEVMNHWNFDHDIDGLRLAMETISAKKHLKACNKIL